MNWYFNKLSEKVTTQLKTSLTYWANDLNQTSFVTIYITTSTSIQTFKKKIKNEKEYA